MLRARLTLADRRALAVLVLVPVLLNLPWALAGHPVLDGDNLTQNYPLRVLTGQLLAHGRLPLWDPRIWSGAPLLAGWNAGAMFPGTWLFAMLPGVAAYELNVIGAGIVCGVGFHLFLRRSACSPLASFLGALTWSEMGFVSGQVVHLGLIEGTVLAPWILLALDGLFRASRAGAGPWHWIALLGACGGLTLLAGDPRAVSNNAIIAVIYLGARCWREPRRTGPVLAAALAGAALATAVGTVQWLPGLSYLHLSQRSVSSLSLFGYYSLGWNGLPLLAVPFLIGGNGNLAMPSYAGALNMPEVTYAVGILPLVALFALAPQLVRGRRGGHRPALGVWYLMFATGVVLSAGTNTPLAHLLVHVPLYGGQRDQNRNAAICDFALAVLLALFVDALRAAPGAGAETVPEAGAETAPSSAPSLSRLLGAVPVACVVGLVAAMFAWTKPMERWLGVEALSSRLPVEMAGYYAVAVAIALAGLVVLVREHWGSAARRRRAAALVVAADALVFIVMASYQPVPLSVLAPTNARLTAALALAHPPAGSRIAIDDPDQLALSRPPFLTDELGVDDLTVLHGLGSVQGYGSAVAAAYATATGTHDVENLLPDGLLGTTFDDLDLGLVAVVPEQFGTILPRGAPVPVPPGPPLPLGESAADRQPGGIARFPYPPSGPWRLGPAGVAWQLPAPTVLSAVTVVFDPAYGPLPRWPLTVVLELASGRRVSLRAPAHGTECEVALPEGLTRAGGGALAVSLRAPTTSKGAPVVGAVVVAAEAASAPLALGRAPAGSVRYVLNGLIQGVFAPPHFVYAGRVGPLVLYRDTRARGQAWLEAPGATSASAPSVPGAVRSRAVAPWQDPVTVVDAPRPSLLVRSEQYAAGWSATLQPLGAAGRRSPPTSVGVRAVGLVQGVEVPAGRYAVTWHYRSPGAELGLAVSGAGSAGCAAFAAAGLGSRRRRLGRARGGR